MNAHELFQAGRLKDAIAALVEDGKARPTDTGARLLLGELLCFSGDLERADNHLDAAGHADPQALPYVVGLRQLIRAEQARRDFFREGRLPQFLAPPEGAVRALLEATVRVRAGAQAEAEAGMSAMAATAATSARRERRRDMRVLGPFGSVGTGVDGNPDFCCLDFLRRPFQIHGRPVVRFYNTG